jgi:hypothetical protein
MICSVLTKMEVGAAILCTVLTKMKVAAAISVAPCPRWRWTYGLTAW